jgi:phosphoglycerate-specific signal transduction histidine kinase
MNMTHLKIGTRLTIGFGVIAGIALALGLVGYYGIVASDKAIEEIGGVRLPSVQALLTLSEAQTAEEAVVWKQFVPAWSRWWKDHEDYVKQVREFEALGVAEMAAAAREQASGIEQVNQAILQMDQVTQQNAALVEETAAASHSMGDQAQELQQLMSFFKLEAGALAAGPAVTTPSRTPPRATRPRAGLPAAGAGRAEIHGPTPVAASGEWGEF